MAAAVAALVKKRNEANRQSYHSHASRVSSSSTPSAAPTPEPEVELPAEGTGIWKYQRAVAKFYLGLRVQLFVAGLIAGNFLFNVLEKWIDPAATEYALLWDVVDAVFNVMFGIELGINMYAFWLRRFWRSGWNIFDFVVVLIGWIFMFKIKLPSWLGLLRMMRAFRVFRLFKRIKSLNKIMMAIMRCIPGVANAFLILLLVMSFYAIVAVEFFRNYGKDGRFTNEQGQEVALSTARGFDYGEEYFGNFGRALYTMFQVLTGESWSEAIARPLLSSNNTTTIFGAVVFFISFNVVAGIILMNVVIACLLEKMVDDSKEDSATAESQDGEVGPGESRRASKDRGSLRGSMQGEAASMPASLPSMMAAETVSSSRVAAMESEVTVVKGDLDIIKNQMDMMLKAVASTALKSS